MVEFSNAKNCTTFWRKLSMSGIEGFGAAKNLLDQGS